MTRAERIAHAKKLIDSLTPHYKLYIDAVAKLKKEEASFDVGEKVIAEEFCGRGCCIEATIYGTITGIDETTSNYSIKKEGTDELYLFHGSDIKRDNRHI